MPVARQYRFGDFCLDTAERCLTRNGELVPLTPKALETLLFLVEHHGHIVEKKALMEAVWPDTFVEEVSLARNVSVLRRVFTENEESSSFIETIPKRGYRFVATVDEANPDTSIPLSPRPVETPSKFGHRWFAWTALLVLIVGGLGTYLWRHRSQKAVASSRPMLAVLPVQNLTGNPDREYVSDGLTEEIIAQLGSLNPQRLGVIARTTAMAYKGTSKGVDQIGRELSVGYILESSIRGSPDQMRFTAQLIRTADQTHIWAHSYERPFSDVVALQRELARTVGEEIQVSVSPQSRGFFSRTQPISADAYDAYIQGRYHWSKRSSNELLQAVNYFRQAIAKAPDFAPAYGGLADSYAMLGTMRQAPPQELMPKAKDALIKALALDDSLADLHTSLGWIYEEFDWDWKGAERELSRAVQLDPNNANSHHRYAIHLAAMGRFPEALSQMRQAQQLDPLSPVMMTSTAWVLLRGRLPDAAIPECRKALDLDPRFVRGHLCLGEAYEQEGDLAGAAQEFLRGKILAGDDPQVLDALRQSEQKDGYYGYFRTRLTQLEAKVKTAYVSPFDFADTNIRLGNKDETIKWLQVSYQERSPYLVNLQIEPRMDSLRSDPRFQTLVSQLGLSDVHIIPIDSRLLTSRIVPE